MEPKVILGLLCCEYPPGLRPENWWNAPNELAIDFVRFGDLLNPPAQFVGQPFTRDGNRHQFGIVTDGPSSPTTHAFQWRHDEVVFRSWQGHADEPDAGDVIETWSYTGPDNARPEEPRVHMNLWLFEGYAQVWTDHVREPVDEIFLLSDENPRARLKAVFLAG